MKSYGFLAVLVLALGLAGCGGDDDGGTPVDPVTPEEEAAANELAGSSMTDLMGDMEEAMPDGVDPEALMDLQVQDYLDDANEALALDPDCATAHFLAALIEYILMAQDEQLQAWILDAGDQLGDLLGGLEISPLPQATLLRGGLAGRSFAIMHRAPLALVPSSDEIRVLQEDKVAIPLVRTLQGILRHRTLPSTDRIVGHLTAVERHPDWQLTIIDEGDTTELDLGEVYVLDACTRALRAGLQVTTAYDIEPAPTGDYSWLTGLQSPAGYTSYEVREGTAAGDTLVLIDDEEADVDRQEIFVAGLQDLLAPSSDFLTLWTDPWSGRTALQSGYDEMNLLLSRLESAYDSIQDEADDQDHDIISQALIAELDAAIAEMGADLPDWLGTWQTIPEVIAWVEDLISGPYTIPIDVNDTETYDLTVDLSALFLEPVADWKTKLPYHEFLPRSEWATFAGEWTQGPYGGYYPQVTYTFVIAGEDVDISGIGFVMYVEREWETEDPLNLLDGPGGHDIADDVFPYFPDYTFGGLFPDMTRAGWLTLTGDVTSN